MIKTPRVGSKQFEAIVHFGDREFTSSEVQRWAIKMNDAKGIVARGYWCVNMHHYRYGLLTRFATKTNGKWKFDSDVVRAVNTQL
jgi:hypothetical protein